MVRRYHYEDEEIETVFYCWFCDEKMEVWEDDMEKGLMHVKCNSCIREIGRLEKDFDKTIEKLEDIVRVAHKNNNN